MNPIKLCKARVRLARAQLTLKRLERDPHSTPWMLWKADLDIIRAHSFVAQYSRPRGYLV